MEAIVFLIFFGLYIFIRVLFGGGESDWEKQALVHKEGVLLFKSRQFSEAREWFEKSLKRRPYDCLNMVMLGDIAYYQNEPERALFYGQKALRFDNTMWQTHLLMSKSFYAINETEEALKYAKKAVWFGRKSGDAQYWYGKLMVEKGQMENGLQHLAQAYALGEEEAGPYLKTRKFLSNS
jgi:tetratricopeptide (TPR) repeat protein